MRMNSLKDDVVLPTDTFGEHLKVAIPVMEEALDIMTEIKLFMWLMDHPEDHEAYQECEKILDMVQKLPDRLQGLINIRKRQADGVSLIAGEPPKKCLVDHSKLLEWDIVECSVCGTGLAKGA